MCDRPPIHAILKDDVMTRAVASQSFGAETALPRQAGQAYGRAAAAETSPSRLPQAVVPRSTGRRAVPRHEERVDRHQSRQPYHRAAADLVDPLVQISPSDSVKRRTAIWPGMAAEIVQATRHDRIETRFRSHVHLLAVYERGIRHQGETFIGGLPRSTLRNVGRKLVFVPAGCEYHDWQEPHILSRVAYFYFDPARLSVDPELSTSNIPLAPRLFFENAALWDTALKLTTLIESADAGNRLYLEALGVVLAHDLVRSNAGMRRVEPKVRGGLAAWQQRTLAAYIEDHLAEPISLATLAQLVRLSPFYFCRAFKHSFGVPPHRYHAIRRIERAKSLLAMPDPSVTDIGFTVGFGQTSSFSAAFRRACGMTPTAYHRSLR
jgi:AraC family transcriptional regulator